MVTYNFHVRNNIRTKYGIEDSLFTVTGDLIIANFYQARLLAQKINQSREEEGKTDQLVTAGLINGLGLLHEIFHFLIRLYEEKENPGVFSRSLQHLEKNIGKKEIDGLLLEYLNHFPAPDIFNKKITPSEFLSKNTGAKPNREIIIEELILLHLENENPAAVKLQELFSDKELAVKTGYLKFINETEKFFITEKPFGAANLPLIDFLKEPLRKNILSIEAQLDYVREKWGVYIYALFNERLLTGKDLIKEDEKFLLKHFGFGKPSPPVPAYEFDRDYFEMLRRKMLSGEKLSDAELQYYQSETERFTSDIDWMPRVVMMAKNVFVWLDQLSKKYQREIRRLDQIPDEELDNLARQNFTALWLIGVWERSNASKKIKQSMGNPEAAASAYSLFDYVIAEELGGESAFQNLKDRSWQRGIRMASDMVPNHTGIYSKWVIEKPDYFIQSDHPPYPSYSFHSTNLSDDYRVEVKIEDKYYNHSDAAVVFQRRDSYTNDIRYIYHGNDGTHMPWNDTAQLNLLNPEVRESLIQTIMHVARKTPIIRFDAAMTLTKKHFQRLWFPIPGTGSGIPSRSDYAMTRSQFDEAMPEEFWREVVDRINTEMPETLLLAEAFWLMESYFVRTLGMHRVYNSAFMHMLMKEENEKYRMLIKNTLSFNPEILKRYVNFMSNPDEETAVNQFGKGDKYFGTAVVMITLPGLPMFGHGQIEGLAEKYGMEYKRAYYDEHPDEHLVRRHEAEIFPLMAKRYLFSQVNHFQLYDFIDDNSNVVENVFAYSNRAGNERTLVLYNNSYTETRGCIKYPVHKYASGSDIYVHRTLGDALGINPGWKIFYIYRDHRTNLEYLISGFDIMEHGIYLYLSGYQYCVMLDFQEVYDEHGDYERLRNYLSGRGVPSIRYAMEELKLMPFHSAMRHIMSEAVLDEFDQYTNGTTSRLSDDTKNILKSVLNTVNHYDNIHFDTDNTLNRILQKINSVREVRKYLKLKSEKPRAASALKKNITKLELENDLILPFILLYQIKKDSGVRSIFSKTRFGIPLYETVQDDRLRNHIGMLDVFTYDGDIIEGKTKDVETDLIRSIFKNEAACRYLNVNIWQDITYFNKENFEILINWYQTLNLIESADLLNQKKKAAAKDKETAIEKSLNTALKAVTDAASNLLNAAENSQYEKDRLIKEIIKKKSAVSKKKTAAVKAESGTKKTVVKKNPSVKKTAVKKKKDK